MGETDTTGPDCNAPPKRRLLLALFMHSSGAIVYVSARRQMDSWTETSSSAGRLAGLLALQESKCCLYCCLLSKLN